MKIYHKFLDYIENGDILLPVILIAVVHYAYALSYYDFFPVAAAIGFLVDIGHYRTVKLYFEGKNPFWAIVLTIWSFFMHWYYYHKAGAEIWAVAFAATIPLVIFALGWITKTQKLDEKLRREVRKEDGEIRENPMRRFENLMRQTENFDENLMRQSENLMRQSENPMRRSENLIGQNGNLKNLNENLEEKTRRNPNKQKEIAEIMKKYGVSRSTAYRYYNDFLKESEENN